LLDEIVKRVAELAVGRISKMTDPVLETESPYAAPST